MLGDKAYHITENPKYDRYQRGLASIFHKIFDKKTSDIGIRNDNISNKELAEELHKSVVRSFQKRTVFLPFIDNSWGADLADMQ